MKRKELALAIILTVLHSGCGQLIPPDYGVKEVKMPDGQSVYFKREVRGPSYDLMVISSNNKYCNMPDNKLDYIYNVLGPTELYYKIEGYTLILYGRFAADPPETMPFPVTIIQKEFEPLDFLKLKQHVGELGLTRLVVDTDEKLKCD